MGTRRERLGLNWTTEQLKQDCEEARKEFRHRRMLDPLVDYLNEYEVAKLSARRVIDALPQILAQPVSQELLANIVRDKQAFTALRYVVAPPISADDLDTLLAERLSATALRRDPDIARNLVELVQQTVDPERFPWLRVKSRPTKEELASAIATTATAIAIERVRTKRRGDEKAVLQGKVQTLLDDIGYKRVSTRSVSIEDVEDLPGPGEYMTEATLHGDNGDFVIGLPGRYRLGLECKGSNSAINSRKRLNKEIVKNAQSWKHFGGKFITGGALQGVFDVKYVEAAQDFGVLIFWGHRLDDLRTFIEELV